MAQYITLNSNQLTELINAIMQGGGSGVVDDILVNGISVINNRIARIQTHIVLTLSEYNQLSNEEKNNGCIYLVIPNQSTDYTFHETQDGTIVIRVNQNLNENLCFFCGFDNTTGEVPIPSDISSYIPNNYFSLAPNYPNGETTQNGWCGFYNNNVRLWTQDKGSLISGVMYGVLDLNQNGEQITTYSDPYDILQGEFSIYCKNHKFSSFMEV